MEYPTIRRVGIVAAGVLVLVAGTAASERSGSIWGKPHKLPPTTTVPAPTTSTSSSTTTTTTTVAPTTTTTATTLVPPTPVSTCGTLTAGNYVLTADIDLASGIGGDLTFDCLTVRGPGVSLDCQGHSVGSWDRSWHFVGATGAHITNCVATASGLVEQSDGITFQNVTFRGGTLNVDTSNHATVTGNSFTANAVLQMHGTSDSTVSGNTFVADSGQVSSAQLVDSYGLRNLISQNVLDGAGGYLNGAAHGFDDGIFATSTTSDQISGNRLANYWDAGIETEGLVTNTTFDANTVTSAPKGIGGWYWSSWQNNTVSHNTFSNVSFAWYLFNDYGAPAGQTVIYFTGNQFIGNIVTAYDTSPDQPDSVIKVDVPDGPFLDQSTGQPTTMPQQIVASGNILTGNNWLTSRFAPSLVPAAAFVDGGGNVCGPAPTSLEPIHC